MHKERFIFSVNQQFASKWQPVVWLLLFQIFIFSIYFYFNQVSSVYQFSGDAYDYNHFALLFLKHIKLNNSIDRLPGFIIYLALIYAVFGKANFVAVFVFNILCTLLVSIALYFYAYHIAKNKWVAILTSVLFIVNPITLYFNFMVLSEPFATFIILYSLIFFHCLIKYNSLLAWLAMTLFYLFGMYTKIYIFFLFPVLCLVVTPYLIRNRKKLVTVGLLVTFVLGLLAYQGRVIYVEKRIGYGGVFSYASEILLNLVDVTNIQYYATHRYKSDLPYTRKQAKAFYDKYQSLAKRKGIAKARQFRYQFYWDHKYEALLAAINGTLVAVFGPTTGYYTYQFPDYHIKGMSIEKSHDLLYLFYNLNKPGVKLFLLRWFLNMVILLASLYLVHKRLKVNVWLLLFIMAGVFWCGPVEGIFAGLSQMPGRFRYVAIPFMSFCYSIAIWAIYCKIKENVYVRHSR